MINNTVDNMTPAFVENFSCAADKCPDHCCHTWQVSVEKNAYKKWTNSKNLIIKQLANSHVKLTRSSHDSWGVIDMKPNGDCPFLDSKNLCEIHKNSGHNSLSHTCQSYPRAYFWFGDHIESSLSLSCPSAAKNILFDPSSMMFNVKHQTPSDINHGKFGGLIDEQLPSWMPTLREACFNIILFQELSIEQRLFVLGMLLKQSEQHLHDQNRLQQFILTVEEMITDGSFANMFNSLPVNHQLQWVIFTDQDQKLVSETMVYNDNGEKKLSTSHQRFDDCRQCMLQLFNKRVNQLSTEAEQINEFARILTDAQPLLTRYFDENQHVLTNYLLYYFYHHQFMYNHNKTPFEFFTVLSVDFFILKCYLSAMALSDNGLNDTNVLTLFQSYARRRQHEHKFVDNMEAQLKRSNADSAAAIFNILK